MPTQSGSTLTELHEFTRAILAAETLDALAEAATSRLVASGFANRVFVRMQRAEGTPCEHLSTRNASEAAAYQIKGLAGMTVERVTTWQEALIVPDVLADAALAEAASTYDVDLGSVICLPLSEAADAGAIYFDRAAHDPVFTEDELAIAQHYALLIGRAGQALDRIETGQRRQDHQEALLGIFRTVSGVMELSTLLDQVAQLALAITQAERAFVLMVAGDELTYGAGRDRESVLPATNFKRISHSVCRQVLESGQEVCIFDAGDDANARQSVVNLQLQGIVAVPLIGRDGLVGILYIDSRMRNLDGLRKEMKLVRSLSGVASLMVENARMYQRVTVDPKTGLFTQSLFAIRMEEEIARAKRYARPCALLVMAVDGFDQIRDEHGPDRAEVALRLVAQIMRTQARGGIDFPSRLADDRVAVILPETSRDGAWTLAERIREKVGRAAFGGSGDTALGLTISVGVALWRSPDGTSAQLLHDAQRALAQAGLGGNKTVMADATAR